MNTSALSKKAVFSQIENMINRGGPSQQEYIVLDTIIDHITTLTQKQLISEVEITEMKKKCGFINDPASVMGHIKCKPYGYAGDFEIIDRIYTHGIKKEEHQKWDTYSLNNAAAQAVRNRKAYFNKLIAEKMANREGNFDLLNVASGPARDLFEAYSTLENVNDLNTTCVEMDPNAIAFAKQLNRRFLSQIDFRNANIFRFRTEEKFDLIWSAGLFDYFDDKAFKMVLSRFKSWLKPGGEIVVGNFNDDHNPSRAYMEIWGEWYLKHRSVEDLERLALETGFDKSQIHVGREPENINLFLHLRG